MKACTCLRLLQKIINIPPNAYGTLWLFFFFFFSVFLLIWDFGLLTLCAHNYFPCRYFFFLGQSRGRWFNLLLLPGRRSNLALGKHCGLHNRCLVFLLCVSVYVCMSLLMHAFVCVCGVWMCECVLQATDVVLLGFQRVYKYVNAVGEHEDRALPLATHTLGIRGFVYHFLWRCELLCSSFCFSTQMSFSFNIVFTLSLSVVECNEVQILCYFT